MPLNAAEVCRPISVCAWIENWLVRNRSRVRIGMSDHWKFLFATGLVGVSYFSSALQACKCSNCSMLVHAKGWHTKEVVSFYLQALKCRTFHCYAAVLECFEVHSVTLHFTFLIKLFEAMIGKTIPITSLGIEPGTYGFTGKNAVHVVVW